MKQILPGVLHWTKAHPKIGIEVSSYFLSGPRIAIDPQVPDNGLDVLEDGVACILLTNRHHYRDSGELVSRFGCPVMCVDKGMHEFTHGEKVEPFRHGDTLPGGIEAIEIGGICPDETALLIPGGALAVADGVVRDKDGPLGFVPDEYMGDDPAGVKKALREAYRRLLSRDFDHLLLAHGHPVVGGAKKALESFIG